MSTSTKSRSKVVAYRDYLELQLRHARGRIKTLDLVTGAAIVFVGAIAYVLSLIVLDQLFELAAWVRLGMLATFILSTAGYLAYAIVLPAVRRINVLYAASEVERSRPETKNSLTNWLQLREQPDPIPSPVMTAIETRAAADLAQIDLGTAIESKHLLRALYVLAAVVVLFCAYTFFSSKQLGPSLKRVLMPLAGIAPPTATRLTVEPGHASIAAGERLAVSAISIGSLPEKVTMYASSDNGEYWEPYPLEEPVGEDIRWQMTLHDVQRSFDYFVVANDYRSERFRITVKAAPIVTDWQVTYEYPAYTGLPDLTVDGGDIDALEGTMVRVLVATNVPPVSGEILLDLDGEAQTKSRTMIPADGAKNELRGAFPLSRDGTYRVTFVDVHGRSPQIRPVKQIKVRTDLAPAIAFVQPPAAAIEKPANAKFSLRAQASDDFGLSRVRIVMLKADNQKLLIDHEERSGLETSTLALAPVDLEPYRLVPGDVLEYYAEAWDNKRPTPNYSATTQIGKRTIRIVEPVDPSEREEPEPSPQAGEPSPTEQTDPQQQQQEGGESSQDQPSSPQSQQPGESKESQDGAADSNQSAGEGGAKSQDERDLSDEDKDALNRLREYLKDKQPDEPLDDQQQSPPSEKQPQQKQADQKESASEQQRENQSSSQKQSNDQSKPSPKGASQQQQQRSPAESSEPHADQSQPKPSPPDRQPGAQGARDDSIPKQPSQPQQAPSTRRDPEQPNDPRDSSEDPKEATEEQKRADGKSDVDERQDRGVKENVENDANSPPTESTEKSSPATKQKEEPAATDARQKDEPKQQPTEEGERKQDLASSPQPQKQQSGEQKQTQGGSQSGQTPADGKSEPGAANQPEEKPDGTASQAGPQEDQQGAKQSSASKKNSVDVADNDDDKQSAEKNRKMVSKQPEIPGGDPSETDKKPDTDQPPDGVANGQKKVGQAAVKKENPGAGKRGENGEDPKPNASQPGKAAAEDQGEEKGRSGDDTPRPEDTQDPEKEKNPLGSRKEGANEEAAASSSGNQDGKANQGESSKSGQSASGSPSKDAGDNSNSAGEQKGEGQTEGSGDSKPAEKSGGKSSKGSGEGGGGEGESEKPGKGGEGQGKSDAGDKEGQQSDRQGGQGNRPATSPGRVGEGSDDPGRQQRPPQDTFNEPEGAAPDQDDMKKASNLVLKRIQDQLKNKKVDPEMLKKLGMTEADLRQLAERLKDYAQPAAKEKTEDPLLNKQRKEFGVGTELRTSVTRKSGQTVQDDQRELFQGRRIEPPEEFRKRFEEYTRRLSRTRTTPRAQPAPKASKKK